MARQRELIVEADRTAEVTDALACLDGVVSLVVQRGGSVMPAGDVVRVTATNAGARAVLRVVDHRRREPTSENTETLGVAATAVTEPLSVKAVGHHHELLAEASEATLNDMEGQLRRESDPGVNFYALMGLAGALAAVGLMTETVYMVLAAMVLAPGFEPFLRVPFALIAGAHGSVGRGLVSLVSGYTVLAAGAAVAIWVMHRLDVHEPLDELSLAAHWATTEPVTILVAVIGGLAGATTVTAGRPEFTAGVMIALGLIPTAALTGMAAVSGDWSLAGDGMARWLTDGLAVSAAAVVVIGTKSLLLHRRRTQD